MKLEYLDNVNDYNDNVVRLYDFDKLQANRFQQEIEQTIIKSKKQLNLTTLDYIQVINCNLTLRIADSNKGITTEDNINFFCELTIKGFEEMISLLEPFCDKQTSRFQWLYDLDTPTELLFSPKGTW